MYKGLSTNVSSVLIDEKGVFDLNSDHVIISVKLREITQIFLKKQDSYSSIKHFWKFTDDTDWELFRCNLKDNFQDNWANVSNNVNDIWETWCLLTIASCNCFFRFWYRADHCLPSSLSYGRVLLCKRCSRLASRLRFKILSRPLSQKFL
jgi:hypothetical protein